jgi:hypothetical protein
MKNPLTKGNAALVGAYALATLSLTASFTFGFAALIPLALSAVSNNVTGAALTQLEKEEGMIEKDWQDTSPLETMMSAVTSMQALFPISENGSPKDTLEGEQSGGGIIPSEEPHDIAKSATEVEPAEEVFSSEELGAENAPQPTPKNGQAHKLGKKHKKHIH